MVNGCTNLTVSDKSTYSLKTEIHKNIHKEVEGEAWALWLCSSSFPRAVTKTWGANCSAVLS